MRDEIEVVKEPSALQTRVAILEAALECIRGECDLALEVPQIAFSTMCRIASVTRQVLPVAEG